MILEKGIDCKGNEYQVIDIGKAKNHIGEELGRLTVLNRVKILNKDYNKKAIWLCQCTCGNVVAVPSTRLYRKVTPTRSCGCLQKESISKLGISSRNDLTNKIVNNIKFLKFN